VACKRQIIESQIAPPNSHTINASILSTCPRDCYDTCGIIVNKINDEITQVRGDPNHAVSQGQLCKKCSIAYNHEWTDPKAI
jgi:anaerobic selenocysteine-containing dehydrogenase